MMLEKIKNFPQKFKTYSEEEISLLGFVPTQDFEMQKIAIAKGRWGIVFFGNWAKFNDSNGIRIMPLEKSEHWPVYERNHLNNAFLYTPDIPSFIVYNHYFLLRKYRTNGIKYKANWQKYYDMMLPVYEHYGGLDDLAGLKKTVFDEENWPEPNLPELPDKDYISFMIEHTKDKDGATYLFDLIKKVTGDKDYLPEIPPAGLGIWEQRIWSITGMRGYRKAFEQGYKKIDPLLFGCFMQPHGYDAEGLTAKVMPNESNSSNDMMWDLAKTNMTLPSCEHLQEITDTPEYKAMLTIEKVGKGYNGLQHIEAAAILDSEMNQPLRAWNCLLSAGYWAGLNKPQLLETIMEAAIYLCRKHKWTEAADAVQYNLDIYKSA